jgi:ABC-type Mn2+/Zn2+ transport system permease subunit
MLTIAATSAIVATVTGILVSYHLDASTGGCIVLVQAVLFFGSLLLAPKYGIMARQRI